MAVQPPGPSPLRRRAARWTFGRGCARTTRPSSHRVCRAIAGVWHAWDDVTGAVFTAKTTHYWVTIGARAVPEASCSATSRPVARTICTGVSAAGRSAYFVNTTGSPRLSIYALSTSAIGQSLKTLHPTVRPTPQHHGLALQARRRCLRSARQSLRHPHLPAQHPQHTWPLTLQAAQPQRSLCADRGCFSGHSAAAGHRYERPEVCTIDRHPVARQVQVAAIDRRRG